MNSCEISFAGMGLTALHSGALYLAGDGMLVVSDLHLGRSERVAREAGPLLPPYEVRQTLERLQADLAATGAGTVLCLGDSFDDTAAASGLGAAERAQLLALQEGRRWIWVEGNHDPGPLGLGGTHLSELRLGPLTFRHIALAGEVSGEVSGHYHPKLGLPGAGRARPCFLFDAHRLILPAYGCYTGGLSARSPVLAALFEGPVQAVVTGRRALRVPVTAGAADARSAAPGPGQRRKAS
ncbi:ligase-associated DNA damage response endonuclease PdeM [Pseudoroseicyclus sp. CXY001]|uniref:ligase-associated DNA damage response endonuclease PdeM n=1 Tax=Pseudoroseicyclus sp. CXY001 TaxID=3242492 RepID=UPI003570FD3A